ncbi:MAG: hypothetical protein IPL71_20920 [Anaerolineales bacterium]|uniref:hypothetical protein n=1 Tax=Candidatus Villigracilis proximus TaxID=3140683 RepID=UPI003136D7B6|nr:hypothetical protein [Anaerolineales bacterium]
MSPSDATTRGTAAPHPYPLARTEIQQSHRFAFQSQFTIHRFYKGCHTCAGRRVRRIVWEGQPAIGKPAEVGDHSRPP